MTRLLLVLFLIGAGLAGLHGPRVTHAQGNSDAAHACQQGGYLTLKGSDGNSMTLTGSTSFVDTCIGLCIEPSMPNSGATGGGTYTERDSSGQVISSGIFRIANTPGTTEGLDGVLYFDANGDDTDCAGGTGWREVDIVATMIDSATGAQQWGFFAANTGMGPGPVAWAIVDNNYFTAPVPTNTITC